MSEAQQPSAMDKNAWPEWIRPYLNWKMAAMLVLGFASGLPLMMVFSKLSAWLRIEGIDRATIGGFYAVSLAYSIKVLWAPAVDRLPLPMLSKLFGQRRSWMLLAITGTIIGFVIIAASNPGENLQQTIIGALILAFSGATLDIAIDAWRIESAPNDEQANMAAVYNLGYRFAIMFAGVGLIIAGSTSFLVAYLVMAAVMLILATLVLIIKEPSRTERVEEENKSILLRTRDAIVEPFWQIVARYGKWAFIVLAIVALYRISDFTMGIMAVPFYIDLGFTPETIGTIQALFGPWPIIAGGFIGGFVAVRYSLLPALLAGGILTLLTNGAFALLGIAAGPDLEIVAQAVSQDLPIPDGAIVNTPSNLALLCVIVADNLAAGYVGTVFIAYMSSLVDRRFAATQYALLSSAYAFFCKLAASTTSGPLSETIGWVGFFSVTSLYTVPPMILILILMRYGPDNAKGLPTPS